MMVEFLTLPDGTRLLHTQLQDIKAHQVFQVQFRRSAGAGFDVACCQLPAYQWIQQGGYTSPELAKFEQLLHNYAYELYRSAAECGCTTHLTALNRTTQKVRYSVIRAGNSV